MGVRERGRPQRRIPVIDDDAAVGTSLERLLGERYDIVFEQSPHRAIEGLMVERGAAQS